MFPNGVLMSPENWSTLSTEPLAKVALKGTQENGAGFPAARTFSAVTTDPVWLKSADRRTLFPPVSENFMTQLPEGSMGGLPGGVDMLPPHPASSSAARDRVMVTIREMFFISCSLLQVVNWTLLPSEFVAGECFP